MVEVVKNKEIFHTHACYLHGFYLCGLLVCTQQETHENVTYSKNVLCVHDEAAAAAGEKKKLSE